MGDYASFIPGTYWDADRKAVAFKQFVAMRDAPQMQALMNEIAAVGEEAGDPAAAAAALAPPGGTLDALTAPVAREACVFRRGTHGDVASLIPLIASGELPPIFLEPFVDGFLIVEHNGRPIGCGGVEFYGPDAVIRSVVVDPAARGLGLGLDIARLLEDDAWKSDAKDVYLFTMHAHDFWKRIGYRDLPLDEWPQMVRENWQYQFVSQFPDAAQGVFPMVKRGSS
jgi:amino-acid N-acetyltransferase